jgi:hypothetical protein
MLNENDVVKAKRILSEKILKGFIGTVVMVYQNPSLAYEVEFFDSEGDTIELLTVQPSDIELVS